VTSPASGPAIPSTTAGGTSATGLCADIAAFSKQEEGLVTADLASAPAIVQSARGTLHRLTALPVRAGAGRGVGATDYRGASPSTASASSTPKGSTASTGMSTPLAT